MSIRLICDRCEKAFETDAQPGDKVECPICHDVNIVRAVPIGRPADPAVDRATAAGYPSSTGAEADVLRLRPAMLRARPARFFLLWLGILAGLVFAALFIAVIPAAIGGVAVAAACMVILLVWKLRSMNDGLLITTRRIVDRTGLLSKKTSEIMIKDIRHVVVKQTLWHRVWNCGTLAISSSADDGIEIYMDDVPKPEEVKRIIDLYR